MKQRSLTFWRASLAALLVGIAFMVASGCTNTPTNVDPPATTAVWTVRIGATCSGKLSVVNVYVDNVYKGQAAPAGQVGFTVSIGTHRFYATDGTGRNEWGPTDVNIGADHTTTLDC
jgi:hypothetical protein